MLLQEEVDCSSFFSVFVNPAAIGEGTRGSVRPPQDTLCLAAAEIWRWVIF
jgi:hypothetical protein